MAALWPTIANLYSFDGNANDVIGSNNLTENGTPTYAEGGPFGRYIIFNGSTQYLTAASNSVYDVTTQDFWLFGLIYRTSDSGVDEYIERKRGAAGGYFVRVNGAVNDRIEFNIHDGSAGATVSPSEAVALNTWYAYGYSATRASTATGWLYNLSTGTLTTESANISAIGSLTNTDTFTVARNSAGAVAFFPGRMDTLIPPQIGSTLSQAQFLALVGAMRPGMTVLCSETGSGFTKGITYRRNVEGTDWVEEIDESSTQTLTNKTIDDDNNTLSNIDADSTKTGFTPGLIRKLNCLIGTQPAAVSGNWVDGSSGTGSVGFTYNATSNVIQPATGGTSGGVGQSIWPLGPTSVLSNSFMLFAGVVGGGATSRSVIGMYSAAPSADTVNGYGFRATDSGNVFAINGNGSSATTTDLAISSSATRTYCAIYSSGSIKFYVDGSLVATHSTNLPTSATSYAFRAYVTNTANNNQANTVHCPVIAGVQESAA